MEKVYVTITSSGLVYVSGKIPDHLKYSLRKTATQHKIDLEKPDPSTLLGEIRLILNGTPFERSDISLSVETPSGTRVWEGTWNISYQEYLR